MARRARAPLRSPHPLPLRSAFAFACDRSPRVALEERPLQLSGTRIARARADAVGADRGTRPRVAQVREGAELDLSVAGTAVVEVALPTVAVRTGLRDRGVRRLAAVLLRPERGRRREAALRR